MAVKRYSSYKPSGALWASDIPAHWRSERLKEHADNINAPAKGKDHSSSYIALEHVESWTGKITPDGNGTNFESQAKQFEPGDVLFGKLVPT